MKIKKLYVISYSWLRGPFAWFCIRLVLEILTMWLPSTQAFNLPESTNKLLFARELDRTYVDPMLLPGKPASYALETLLGEGFRCRLDLISPIGLDEPPLTKCIRSSTRFAPQCPDLYITVRFERQPEIHSREELLRKLDSVSVHSAMAFCPYPDEVSSEFVTAHDVAEASLAQQVKAMKLPDSALAVHEKLIMQDYYCGFEIKALEEGGSGAPQMICTRWRTQIRYCHEARLAMDVDWPAGVTSIGQLYGALDHAKVKAIRSSCELPRVISSGESASQNFSIPYSRLSSSWPRAQP